MAWTERYVRADAAGGGDGTTDANSGANGAWTLAEGITNESAGMRINMRAGTYANATTNRTWSAIASMTAPIWWRGFKTTAGDLDARPTSSRTVSTDMPHLTWSTGQALCTGQFRVFSCMSFLVTGSNGTGAFRATTSASQVQLHRCRFEHQSTGSANNWGLYFQPIGHVSECYIKAPTTTASYAASIDSGRCTVANSVIIGGATGALRFGSTASAIGNIVANSSGNGISNSASNTDILFIGNTVYNVSGHGIAFDTTSAVRCYAINNLLHTITGASKYGIASIGGTNVANIFRCGNAYYNVTTPENGFGDHPDFDRITEGSDPLTDPSNGDFRYKTTATGFQAGLPGLFEGLTVASYASPGAQIPDEVSSGGGSAYIIGG